MSAEPRASPASAWRRQRRPSPALRSHAPALAALALLAAFLFRDVLFGGQVFYHRDVHLQWHVQALAFARSVFAGSWPVWNPWMGFGQPLWANPNNQVLYPFTWLHVLMPPWTYYTCFVAAHVLFSAAGAYLLACRLGLSRGAAFVGAAVWICSGPFLSLVDLWNHLAAAAWIPWIVLAGDVALASGHAIHVVAWGATLAVPVLAGSPEMGLMAGLVLVPLALSHARRPEPAPRRRWLATVLGALVFAVGLSTAQWWPTLELLRESPRLSELFRGSSTFWSIHPLAMLQALLPVFPDRLPLSWEFRSEYFEGRESYLPSLYLGLSSLTLVLAGAGGRRRRLWLVLMAMAAASAWFALGRHTRLYEGAVAVLPPLRMIRFPAKAMVLCAFCWAGLAGVGFDAWRQREPGRSSRIAALLALVLGSMVAGGLAFLARDRAGEWGSAFLYLADSPRSFAQVLAPTAAHLAMAAALALAAAAAVVVSSHREGWAEIGAAAAASLLLLDLVWAHDRLNPTASRQLWAFRPPALDVVKPSPYARIYVYDYFYDERGMRYLGHRRPYLTAMRQEDWPVPWLEALALRGVLYPTVAGAWNLQTAFPLDTLQLYPPPLLLLTNALREVEGTPFHSRLLQIGAVEDVVALHRQGFEDLLPVSRMPTLFVEPMLVFRVPDPLPRTYAVGAARRAGDVVSEIRTLAEPSFDPAREILLPAGPSLPAPAPFSGRSRIVDFRPDRVRLEAEMSAPGYVVLVDAYDPGWRASVDGRPAEMLRANVAFRAVAVPAGRHVVEHLYRPRSVSGGLAVSAVALLAAAVVMAADVRRRWRDAPEAA